MSALPVILELVAGELQADENLVIVGLLVLVRVQSRRFYMFACHRGRLSRLKSDGDGIVPPCEYALAAFGHGYEVGNGVMRWAAAVLVAGAARNGHCNKKDESATEPRDMHVRSDQSGLFRRLRKAWRMDVWVAPPTRDFHAAISPALEIP